MTQQTSAFANDLTIFVNTSDNFDDCWGPFFRLFNLYWPDCPFPIVLNTETKDYQYKSLDITCSKVSAGDATRIGWSECLLRALDKIQTPYILYLQEDYFLESPVKEDRILDLLNELRAGVAGAIRFSGSNGIGPFHPTKSSLILEVDKSAKWRLSLQAGLWKKSVLASLVRKHETPWQLESYGSIRTRWLKDKICCVNSVNNTSFDNEIFPYTPTGVVAGRWVREVVEPLFKKHEIDINFSIRGFHFAGQRLKKRKAFLLRLVDRVRSLI